MKKLFVIAILAGAITLLAQSQALAWFRVGVSVPVFPPFPGVVATVGVPGPYYYPGYYGPGYYGYYGPGYYGYYGRGYWRGYGYGRGYWRGDGHGWGRGHGRWGGHHDRW